jgi:hypothetical protein
MNSQPESVVAFDVVQYQNARIWQEGLRMACGRCHRFQRLKHFIYNAFYAESIKIAEESFFNRRKLGNISSGVDTPTCNWTYWPTKSPAPPATKSPPKRGANRSRASRRESVNHTPAVTDDRFFLSAAMPRVEKVIRCEEQTCSVSV